MSGVFMHFTGVIWFNVLGVKGRGWRSESFLRSNRVGDSRSLVDSTELITTREELEQCLKHRGPAKGTRELADSHIEPFAFLCQFLASDALSHSGLEIYIQSLPGQRRTRLQLSWRSWPDISFTSG